MNVYCKMNPETKFFEIKPGKDVLFATAEPKQQDEGYTEFDSSELLYMAARFGFRKINIDGKVFDVPPTICSEQEKNTFFFEQYLLTNDKKWLEKIIPDGLLCLCRIHYEDMKQICEFATGRKDGEDYILTFTPNRFAKFKDLFKEHNYTDFSVIRFPFVNINYVINMEAERRLL